MSRLIDADALMDALGIAVECKDCSRNGTFGCKEDSAFVYACEAITDAPTIDPVKHGRWTYKAARARSVYFIQHVQCNVCGHIRPRLTGDILRYCPHCGARMDEVTE